MTVYVDDANIKFNGTLWCHLIAEDQEELDRFAQSIGLKLSYKHNGTHYDVTPGKRKQAVSKGAVEVTAIAAARLRMLWRRKAKSGKETQGG